jgi:hypothetical protein
MARSEAVAARAVVELVGCGEGGWVRLWVEHTFEAGFGKPLTGAFQRAAERFDRREKESWMDSIQSSG